MSRLSESLRKGQFVLTSEVGPPKGTDVEGMIRDAQSLAKRVAAINVTDLQSSVMRAGSLAVSKVLLESGVEPVSQLPCRDRNRLALQADLLFASSRGIQNVLCLTGDSIILGDHKDAKSVFDMDSSQLVETIRILESGKDLGGNDLDGAVSFCAGAIVTPEADPIEPQLIKFEKKIEAGAEFIQTQAVYDLDKFKEFMDYARQFDAKILAGIILLTSAPMARFMNKNIAGVSVPQDLIDEMASAPKGQAITKGIEIAGRMIKRIHEEKMCDGVHIMAIGKEELVPDIMVAAGIV